MVSGPFCSSVSDFGYSLGTQFEHFVRQSHGSEANTLAVKMGQGSTSLTCVSVLEFTALPELLDFGHLGLDHFLGPLVLPTFWLGGFP